MQRFWRFDLQEELKVVVHPILQEQYFLVEMNLHHNTNVIDYMTIASKGDAIDFGDCINGSSLSNACSSPTRAIFGDMTGDGESVFLCNYCTLGNATRFW